MRPTAFLQRTVQDSRNWDLREFVQRPNPKTLAFLNAHAITTAHRDTEFAQALWEADMVLRDGIGVRIGLIFFGYGKTKNLNGTDLITKVLMELNDKPLAIFGSTNKVMEDTASRLRKDSITSPKWLEHGFHDIDYYLEHVQRFAPDVILLCMGMPRQEILAAKLRQNGYKGFIICGGGWADFYSGNKRRAPLWMRKLRLEWLFRLLLEPRRLGKRYTIDIAIFFWVLLCDRLRNRLSDT